MSELVTFNQGRNLVQLTEAKRQIALAREMAMADELHEWRDRAAAMAHYARMRGDSQEAANQAAEIKVRAEAALGALDAEARPASAGSNQHGQVTTPTVSTPVLNVAPTTRSNWRKLGALDDQQLDDVIEQVRATDDTISTAAIVKALKGSTVHVSNNSGENEWYTPVEYITAARKVMGQIDLDPASNVTANEIVEAADFFTVETNGLSQSWSGRVWMNPPYAQPMIADFARKLTDEYRAGDVTEACVLVNNATETEWFQGLLTESAATCFPRTRVKFWHPDRKAKAAPLQGQAVLYLGASRDSFAEHFADFGKVLFRP
jgi:ParB family chromosome partitioning protein